MRLLNTMLLCLLVLFSAIVCVGQQREAPRLFPVENDGKWGFIDNTGKIVIPLQFDTRMSFMKAWLW